jgi:lipopolysaccharide heptosyltransferase II
MTQPKNILIVRTDRIGDVVLTLPLAGIIKKHIPDAKVTFLVSDYTKPLARNCKLIDEVITLKTSNGRLKITENINLLKNKFDACIVAFPTFKLALILFLSKIKIRIGTGYRWYSFLFNKKIYEHRKYGKRHELEYNVQLLNHIGINEDVNEQNVEFNLHPSEKSIQKIKDEIDLLGIGESKKIIIVHPGSGGSAVDLPISKLKKLIERLARELDCEILITGSESEKELCSSLIVNKKTKNVAGKFNLDELITLIDKSDLVIANSTGPIHIGAALGKNIIGFYPKVAACSPTRWGPYTDKKTIFTPNLECKDCSHEQCVKLNCMDTINIDEIFNSVKNFVG